MYGEEKQHCLEIDWRTQRCLAVGNGEQHFLAVAWGKRDLPWGAVLWALHLGLGEVGFGVEELREAVAMAEALVQTTVAICSVALHRRATCEDRRRDRCREKIVGTRVGENL